MKTVFITGASAGIGLQTALLYANNHYKVVGTTRDLSSIKDIKNPNLHFVKMDVSDTNSVKMAVAEALKLLDGKLDIVINNAGNGFFGPLEAISEKQIHNQMDVNFYGVIRVIKAVLPTLKKQKDGTIINISSVTALVGYPLNSIYAASKFALRGLTLAVAQELVDFNIKVKIVYPSGTTTGFQKSIADGEENDKYKQDYAKYFEKVQYRKQDNFDAPEVVAKAIYTAGTDQSTKFAYYVGGVTEYFAKLVRDLSEDEVVDNIKNQLK